MSTDKFGRYLGGVGVKRSLSILPRTTDGHVDIGGKRMCNVAKPIAPDDGVNLKSVMAIFANLTAITNDIQKSTQKKITDIQTNFDDKIKNLGEPNDVKLMGLKSMLLAEDTRLNNRIIDNAAEHNNALQALEKSIDDLSERLVECVKSAEMQSISKAIEKIKEDVVILVRDLRNTPTIDNMRKYVEDRVTATEDMFEMRFKLAIDHLRKELTKK